jgi:hypothetical protein
VTDRRDAADLLTGVLEHELGCGAADRAAAEQCRELGRVDPMGAAGQDQQRARRRP